MIICIKKYFCLLPLILLFVGFGKVAAQTSSDSVTVKCVSVDPLGDVTLTWILPSNASLSADGAQYFIVEASLTNGLGSYSALPIPNIATNNNSVFIPVGSLPISPDKQQIYFYVSTNNSATIAYNSNIVSSIFLSKPFGTGIASFNWNPINYPLFSSASKWFKVYQSYAPSFNWTLIDSVNIASINTTSFKYYYNDTITLCSDSVDYMIQIADSIGFISTSNINGANFSNTIQALAPYMDTVSVSGNNVNVTWSLPPGRRQNIIGYIVYDYRAGIYVPIDTLGKGYTVAGMNTLSYPYVPGMNPDSAGLSFQVAAVDSCKKVGVISSAQNTLFLQEAPDRCTRRNILTWNGYVNMVGSVGGYRIYESSNGGKYQLLGTTSQHVYSYVDSNLNTIELRCYYIQVFDSARKDTTASSNVVCYNVTVPKIPTQNYLRAASVTLYSDQIDQVSVAAYIDSLSGAGSYILQRSADTGKVYTTIDSIASNQQYHDNISFLDNAVNPNTQSYTYRVVTLDSCQNGMDTTNIGQTIYLTAVGLATDTNVLVWNDYKSWYAGPKAYVIFRSTDGINYAETGPPVYYSALSTSVNRYADYIKTDTSGQGTFFYYIKAIENNLGQYPFGDTSYSNVAEAYQDPIVYIPDAFNPYGVNKVFKPVGVFINVTGYDFIILNRWGIKVFESNDPNVGWNGKYNNSKKPEEEDVYVYLLTYTSSKGEYFQRKGTVTLLK